MLILYRSSNTMGAVVVIVWLLDLQLPMQSMPITTDVVSSTSVQYAYSYDYSQDSFISILVPGQSRALGTPASTATHRNKNVNDR
jgi:hypothetical protein